MRAVRSKRSMTVAFLIVVVLAAVATEIPTVHAQQHAQHGPADSRHLIAAIPGLNAEEARELLEDGVLRFHTEDQPLQFRYLPRSSISGRIRESFHGFSPNVVNEVLYLLPIPPHDGDLLLSLYNQLRAVSTLSGVVYRSGHTREDRTLFDNVYAHDGSRARNRIPDPLVTSIPATSAFPLHLVDANFGSSYFEATYHGAPEVISFGMRNTQSLTYLVPVIRPERLRFQLVVLPLEQNLLLYGVVGVEAGGLIRRTVHLPSAFRRRIETLADWFIDRVY